MYGPKYILQILKKLIMKVSNYNSWKVITYFGKSSDVSFSNSHFTDCRNVLLIILEFAKISGWYTNYN